MECLGSANEKPAENQYNILMWQEGGGVENADSPCLTID